MTSKRSDDHALIIGAGLAGLTCAHRLREHGIDCEIFEKGRRAGGRQSTRREVHNEHTLHFDHGAQYFTVRDPNFEDFLAPHQTGENPLVAEWTAPVVALEQGTIKGRSENTRRFVFAPHMNSFAEHLAKDLNTHLSTRVHSCVREGDEWVLLTDEDIELGRGTTLVITAPAAQALALLPDDAPHRDRLRSVRYAPTWAVMLHFPRSLQQSFGGAFVDGSPLSWIANNDSKPGRGTDDLPGENWVIIGTPEWSYAHLDDEPEEVGAYLLEALEGALGRSIPAPELMRIRRWRYALPTVAAGDPCLWDPQWRLGIAGDGCPSGARLEGAFTSGWMLARRIRLSLEP